MEDIFRHDVKNIISDDTKTDGPQCEGDMYNAYEELFHPRFVATC